MKVRFFCNSGANIHSCRTETVDTVKDLGLDPGEWEGYAPEEKQKMAEDWANDRLEIGFEELGDDDKGADS